MPECPGTPEAPALRYKAHQVPAEWEERKAPRTRAAGKAASGKRPAVRNTEMPGAQNIIPGIV